MDTAEQRQTELVLTRQQKLKEWFADKTLPRKEKSTLSQLMRGNETFGPRVARRLERDYGMPRGYLDGITTTQVRSSQGQSFGDRIKTLRKERDLTQLQLAEYVGVSQTAVAAWEIGKREVPKGDNLLKLAAALGLEAGELITATGQSANDSIDEVRLLAAFRSLPKDRQLLAIKLVEALK
jgi:transcriptional regulator with XRE-family HTH domain